MVSMIPVRGFNQARVCRSCTKLVVAAICTLLQSIYLTSALSADTDEVQFERDVLPILQSHCIRCHNPSNPKGEFSLATSKDLLSQKWIVPEEPDGSYLIEVVTASTDEPPAMPKEGEPLKPEDVETLRRWIAAGASWPEGVIVQERSKADKSWWSLQPLASVSVPEPIDDATDWAENPIDRFISKSLHDKGLMPNPPADRRTLIRRATYDLTGLPPTPEEIAAFTSDPSPLAYEHLIDRLLASPRYGERWGRHWLDVIRFGESRGFERNEIITNLWPLRDYVIAAFNDDKPFDQLIREHLTGDVTGKDNPSVEVASAFLVAGPYDDVGNQDAVQAAQIRADIIDEVIRATSEAFLGLTIGCARCHDHKFDPIKQSDYYAWYATFAGVRHGPRDIATADQRATRDSQLQPLVKARDELNQSIQKLRSEGAAADSDPIKAAEQQLAELNKQIAAVPPLPQWWIGTRAAAPGPFHLFLGGSPQRKGDAVAVASLTSLEPAVPAYQLDDLASEADRRIALSNWLAHPKHPLTARVLANRLWHYHFGMGLVDTPSDFGYMGGQPSHPELLDWLALQLQQHDWHCKPLHRTIMLSQTYQQSSGYRNDAAAIDADSRLLWRYPPHRLDAEAIRDTTLMVADQLRCEMGGPGFRLYQYQQDNVATYVPLDKHGPETYRRAVYHHNARASRIDLMSDFDSPDCAFSTPRRAETTTPLQALTMMNHAFVYDMAQSLAARLERETGGEPKAIIERAYQLCYGRVPSDEELQRCMELVTQHGLPTLCRVLLNTSELIYLE